MEKNIPVNAYTVARPIQRLNNLFRAAGLEREIIVREDPFCGVRNGEAIPVYKLSDGERNTILLSASIVDAPPASVIIIDEPERHLHHALTGPLLTALFAERSDCSFIISTHDVSLVEQSPSAQKTLGSKQKAPKFPDRRIAGSLRGWSNSFGRKTNKRGSAARLAAPSHFITPLAWIRGREQKRILRYGYPCYHRNVSSLVWNFRRAAR